MELPQNTILCKCGRQVVLRKSNSERNSGRMYYNCPKAKPKARYFGCEFFSWADVPQEGENCGPGNSVAGISSSGLQRDSSSSPGPSSSGLQSDSSSSPGPSSSSIRRGSRSSPGPSSNCVNCKLLTAKIMVLEAQLMSHEDSSQSAAALQEVSAQLDGLLVQDK